MSAEIAKTRALGRRSLGATNRGPCFEVRGDNSCWFPLSFFLETDLQGLPNESTSLAAYVALCLLHFCAWVRLNTIDSWPY